jgi:hypothetical protein
VAVLLALASAVVYGTADFCGGLASRRASRSASSPCPRSPGWSRCWPCCPGWAAPVRRRPGLGAAAGLAGAAGLVLFYRALAEGVMSVVAPVTAVTAAAVPVLGGLRARRADRRRGPRPASSWRWSPSSWWRPRTGSPRSLRTARPASLPPALAAGAGFGLFFVLLDRTGEAPAHPAGGRPRGLGLLVVARPPAAGRCGWPGLRCRWWCSAGSAT